VTRYTTDEGEKLADMMARLNEHHALDLSKPSYEANVRVMMTVHL